MDNFRVRILKILLERPHGTDVSIREIAKRLDTTSSHVFYYLKKMLEEGILTKEMEGKKGFYKPQPIFGRNVDETLNMVCRLCRNIEDPSCAKLSNCIRVLLELKEWCPKKLEANLI